MKKLLKFFLVIVGTLRAGPAFAQSYNEFSASDATGATNQLWEQMSLMVENQTLFFGVVVVLAILVTGFFLGRKWLRRVG